RPRPEGSTDGSARIRKRMAVEDRARDRAPGSRPRPAEAARLEASRPRAAAVARARALDTRGPTRRRPGGRPARRRALDLGSVTEPTDLRVSDQERERAAAEIREHFAAGRLDADELAERLERAYAART